MRFFLCAAALFYCSVARGEQIRVDSVSADYNTRDDMFRIVAVMDGRPDLSVDAFEADFHRGNESFMFTNTILLQNPRRWERGDTVYLMFGPTWSSGENRGVIPYSIEDRNGKCYFSIEVDGALMNLPETRGRVETFSFGLGFGIRDGEYYTGQGGGSTVNGAEFVPEPSSVAIAAVGIVALAVHRLRRPRFRQRGGKGGIGKGNVAG